MIRKIITSGIGTHLLPTTLNVLLLAFATAIISLILALNFSYNQKVERDLKNIDLVVGAKGSPLQLVLSSVYHLDVAKDYIQYEEAKSLLNNPYVASWTPLAYGDYYKGYKIVGTDYSYLERYDAQISSGRLFENDFEVVLGSEIAKTNHLKIGDKFSGNHGIGEDATAHHAFKYTIVGILEPSESIIDYLFVSNLNSVCRVHSTEEEFTGPQEISAALIELNAPEALHILPDYIDKNTSLMAAVPVFEINKLSNITGLGITLLEGIAWSLVFLSALSIFITIYRSVRNRRYELAIMRMMGATRLTLIKIILLETWITTTLAYLIGLAASRFGIWFIQHEVIRQASLTLPYQLTPAEKYIYPILIIFSTLAVTIPMVYAFRLDISKILAEE